MLPNKRGGFHNTGATGREGFGGRNSFGGRAAGGPGGNKGGNKVNSWASKQPPYQRGGLLAMCRRYQVNSRFDNQQKQSFEVGKQEGPKPLFEVGKQEGPKPLFEVGKQEGPKPLFEVGKQEGPKPLFEVGKQEGPKPQQDRQPKVEVQGNAKPEVAAKDIEKTASIIKNVPPPLHIVQNHGFEGKYDNTNAVPAVANNIPPAAAAPQDGEGDINDQLNAAQNTIKNVLKVMVEEKNIGGGGGADLPASNRGVKPPTPTVKVQNANCLNCAVARANKETMVKFVFDISQALLKLSEELRPDLGH